MAQSWPCLNYDRCTHLFKESASALSKLHILSVTQLLLTTDNLSEMYPLKKCRLLPVLVPLIIHNLTRANGFHKLP